MSRSITLAICLAAAILLLSASRQDGEAPPIPSLSSLDLPLDQLPTGRRVFAWVVHPVGESTVAEMQFTTSVLEGVVTLTDSWQSTVKPGLGLTDEVVATAPLSNELRPNHATCKGTRSTRGGGGSFEFTIGFDPGLGVVTGTSEAFASTLNQIPEGSLTVSAFIRLVSLLPRKAGFRTSFEHFIDIASTPGFVSALHHTEAPYDLRAGGTISCVGAEAIPGTNPPVHGWRFDVTSGKDSVCAAWVDDAGRLMRIDIGAESSFLAKD